MRQGKAIRLIVCLPRVVRYKEKISAREQAETLCSHETCRFAAEGGA